MRTDNHEILIICIIFILQLFRMRAVIWLLALHRCIYVYEEVTHTHTHTHKWNECVCWNISTNEVSTIYWYTYPNIQIWGYQAIQRHLLILKKGGRGGEGITRHISRRRKLNIFCLNNAFFKMLVSRLRAYKISWSFQRIQFSYYLFISSSLPPVGDQTLGLFTHLKMHSCDLEVSGPLSRNILKLTKE